MERRNFLKSAATVGAIGATAAVVAACEEKKEEAKPAAPAVTTKKSRELKMVTTWPKNFPGLGTGAQRLADRITAATDGELTVKLFAAGEMVPPFESFDAVSNGTADMYHGADYYWQGKSKAYNFFTAVPFGLTANENDAWLHWGGGQELWDELGKGFGVKHFAAGNTGVQMGGWFNKEINSLEDYKGLKIRMPGLGGETLRRIGAAAVTLPGGEIFPSLQSGAIDATEWVGPWNDLAFGFYKITKYYYWPGFHEPGSTLSCGVNLKVWEGLSKAHQEAVASACAAENNIMFAEFNAKNGDALNTLLTEHGVVMKRFSDDIMAAIGNAAGEVMAEIGETDAITKKVYESFRKFRADALGWTSVSETAYTHMRGLDYTY